MGRLDGKKIAFLQTDGVEQLELTEPLEAIRGEGADSSLISKAIEEFAEGPHEGQARSAGAGARSS